jgi:hypothetical protein
MDWELTGEITHQETFAEGSKIRELHRLVDAHGTGKVELKIKELL